MSPSAVMLPVALAAAAVTSLGVTRARYDDRDRDRALLVAETARIGPGTRGRIAAFFEATHPGAPITWQAGDPPLFGGPVPVDVQLGDRRYHLAVHLADRRLDARDADTARLLEEIATWAGEK